MTASVGSAAPGAPAFFIKSDVGKSSVSTYRGNAKRPDNSDAPSEDVTQANRHDKIDNSGASVEEAKEVSRRTHAHKNSDDSESSFEETFDSIGQEQSKEIVSPNQLATGIPNSMTARQPVEGSAAEGIDAAKNALDNPQGNTRPTSTLKQASILALLNSKDRLFADVASSRIEHATDQQAASADGELANAATVTVNGHETHWNFDNTAENSAASVASAVQTDARTLTQEAPLVATTAAAQKEQVAGGKPSADQVANRQPQAVVTSGGDQQQQTPSFGDGNEGAGGSSNSQSGTDLKDHAGLAATDRKIGKTETPLSVDQLVTSNAISSQRPSLATDQVKSGLLEALSNANVEASSSSQMTSDPTGRATPTSVLRTLDLTLSPPDLGSVRLRMSLKSNELTIEAEASKASTAKILSDDRMHLEKGLRDAGYDVSSIKIADASASGSANSGGWQTGNSPSRDGEQARSNWSGRQDGEMQRREGSMSDQASRRQRDQNEQTSTVDRSSNRSGNAVYI